MKGQIRAFTCISKDRYKPKNLIVVLEVKDEVVRFAYLGSTSRHRRSMTKSSFLQQTERYF